MFRVLLVACGDNRNCPTFRKSPVESEQSKSCDNEAGVYNSYLKPIQKARLVLAALRRTTGTMIRPAPPINPTRSSISKQN